MTLGELMLLYNLMLENKIEILDADDGVIESKPIIMEIDERVRAYFWYISRKFYLNVVIVNEIARQCKKQKLGTLIEKILTEKLTLKWSV